MKNIRVLLVDDDHFSREPMKDWLSNLGYMVLEADNSIEALKKVKKENGSFDIALIDQVLDVGPDGIETMKLIHQLYPKLPVIIYTGWGDQKSGVRALKSGAYRYLLKPIDPEEVSILIQSVIEFREWQNGNESSSVQLNIPSDIDFLNQLEIELGRKLRRVPLEKITEYDYRGSYALDEEGRVAGLNLSPYYLRPLPPDLFKFPHLCALSLSSTQLEDYSFLKDLPVLQTLDLSSNNISDYSFLKNLHQLQSLDLGSNNISDVSFLENLQRLQSLDLSSNNISDSSFLKDLHQLQSLDLRDNKISDYSSLKNLHQLQSLDLSSNKISDYSFLKNLHQLQSLELSSNKISDYSFLKNLHQLQSLDLSWNNISDGSFLKDFQQLKSLKLVSTQISNFSFLKNLHHLQSLTLSFNKISDVSFLKDLHQLQSLYLRDNKISDVSFLKDLHQLQSLYLRDNKISDVSFLKDLHQLQSLDLSDNKINDVSFLKDLDQLQSLDLSYNQISDVSFLKDLHQLQSLNLSSCEISNFPDSLFNHLPYLFRLDISKNQIRHLPLQLATIRLEIRWTGWPNEADGICVRDNPLESPPAEIVKQGQEAVLEYFRSLEGEKRSLNEVKALLVGEGGAGKTSLLKQLLGEEFDPHELQTHGINIRQRKVKSKKEEVKVHFWDFGGQEIMHATHQFFLSKRSLYILVLDCRKDERAEYWLKHIESFGGDSPILVVINKMDENPGFDLNRPFLQEKYKGIRGFFPISCKTGKGLPAFQRKLQETLAEVELLQTVWPESWFQVKSRLEKMKAHFIGYEEYTAICREEKISEKRASETLVEFLHDLGVILHFKDFELQDTHVLEPKWVTEAVYKIINSPILAEDKGVLKLRHLDEILKPKTKSDYYYPQGKYPYIIKLMRKFELCYKIDDHTVLIPDLLQVRESEFEFDYQNSLKFVFEYDFLPRSVMPRFIVRRNKDIKGGLRWRSGVVLEDRVFRTNAVVKADNVEKKIFIYVNGEQKRGHLSTIRKTLRDIHDSFEKLTVSELVPLPDYPEIPLEYEELVGYELAGKDEYFVGKLRKGYSVRQLLDGIETKEETEKSKEKMGDTHIHISHSKGFTVGDKGNVEFNE